jgi:hypothetical protein
MLSLYHMYEDSSVIIVVLQCVPTNLKTSLPLNNLKYFADNV